MVATYWQEGKNLDYLNNTDEVIQANTLIRMSGIVGVAGTTIAVGEIGTVVTHGVFEMPKKDNTVIAQGTKVFLDEEGITITETAATETTTASTPAGYAAASALAEDKTILVKLLG